VGSPPLATLEVAPVVVTATREERQAFEVAPAVTTIDRQHLERRNPSVLVDLLRGEAGVFVQQTSPGQAAPIIRGLIGSGVLMLVDGMRLNNAFVRPAPNQYFALVDPYNVERLDVVREAGSTLYGSDAMGGVVNVLTPIPRFTSETWESHARALAQFATADTSWVTRLTAEGGKHGVSLRAGFTYQTHDHLRGGRETGVQRPSNYDALAGDGKLLLESGKHELLFSTQYFREPQTPRYDELVPGFGRTRPEMSTLFFEPNDRLFVHGRYRLQKPLSFVDRLEANVSFQEMNDDRRLREYESRVEETEKNRSRMLGATLQLTSRWKDRMTFTYGAEVYLDFLASERTARNLDTGVLETRSGRFADGSRLDSYALFVQDEIRWHPKLTTTIGGRLSYFDIDIAKADRAVGAHLSPWDVTGSLGIIFHAAPFLNVVSNVSRGFRVPNVYDLSTLGIRPSNRFQIPSPNLGSEQVVSVDAGVKVKTARASAELFGYFLCYRDKIEAVETGERTPEGRNIVQSVNLTRSLLAGMEAAGRIRFSERLEVFGALNFTWGEETLPSEKTTPASRIPPLHGQLGLFYQPLPRMWLESFLRFAATQDRLSDRDRTDWRINPNGTPGRLTAHLRLGWQPHSHLLVRLAIDNLFDQDYRDHGSGINAPGLNVILGLEAKL
jgi:outer membrane receptor protein involved in Fe transport